MASQPRPPHDPDIKDRYNQDAFPVRGCAILMMLGILIYAAIAILIWGRWS